jgi:fatty-acyl-CoA synthase
MKPLPTLPQLLASHVDAETPMLIHEDRPVSFHAMDEESRRIATGLLGLGVRAGDRVAIWLPNTPAWLAVFLACARIGAIAVSVNTRFVARELADVLGRSGAKILVCWPGFGRVDYGAILDDCSPAQLSQLEAVVAYAEPVDPRGASLRGWNTVPYADLVASEPLAGDRSSLDAPCVIWTTSGTTKAPKFVLHDQRSLVGHAQDVVAGHGFHGDSILLLAPPLCGAFGLCLAMAMLFAGRPMVTASTWEPTRAAGWIDQYGVTHMHAVDDAIAQLLEQNERTPAFPTLEYCGFGAFNPAQKDIVMRADARGLRLAQMYGTSEIQGLFSRQPVHAPAEVRALGGGYPVSSLVRVRARDPQTGQVLPHGVAGELEVFAPISRMRGYFNDARATVDAFTTDLYYKTGDLGFTREDGSIVFLGRVVDTLRLGGFLASPKEIEGVVEELPGVRACQVVGVNAGGALRAIAFVITKAGAALTEEAVAAHCRNHLARYKVPHRVFFVDTYPTTQGANGTKVQKTKLREIAESLV